MDYTELYAQKKMTAEQAAALVKSGDWVDYGWAVNTPVAVDAAIAKRLPELENVNFRGGILMWVPEIFQIDDPAAHMTWNSWHMSGIERKAIAQGFSFYSPIRYSELPRYYRDSTDPVDVAVFQVTPMDEHGYFNFGPSASHLVLSAKRPRRSSWRSTPICRAASAAPRTGCTSRRWPVWWRAITRRWARWPLPVQPPRSISPWQTSSSRRSPTALACSWASAVCPTPSAT